MQTFNIGTSWYAKTNWRCQRNCTRVAHWRWLHCRAMVLFIIGKNVSVSERWTFLERPVKPIKIQSKYKFLPDLQIIAIQHSTFCWWIDNATCHIEFKLPKRPHAIGAVLTVKQTKNRNYYVYIRINRNNKKQKTNKSRLTLETVICLSI